MCEKHCSDCRYFNHHTYNAELQLFEGYCLTLDKNVYSDFSCILFEEIMVNEENIQEEENEN